MGFAENFSRTVRKLLMDEDLYGYKLNLVFYIHSD